MTAGNGTGESVDAPKRKMHANSLANLRPAWKKGESGNDAGYRGPLITPAMRRMAQLPSGELLRLDPNRMTVAEVIALGYLCEAISTGFDRGRSEVLERLDGKVAQPIEHVNEPPAVAALRELQQAMTHRNGHTANG